MAATETMAIGSRRELFVDDWLIDQLDGAVRVLQSPVPIRTPRWCATRR